MNLALALKLIFSCELLATCMWCNRVSRHCFSSPHIVLISNEADSDLRIRHSISIYDLFTNKQTNRCLDNIIAHQCFAKMEYGYNYIQVRSMSKAGLKNIDIMAKRYILLKH